MAATLHAPDASRIFDEAERRRVRTLSPDRPELRFRSIRHALQWFYEARDRVAAPGGMHPRGQRARDGSTVVLDVQGGQPVDTDEVNAVLLTVNAAILDTGRVHDRGMQWLAGTIVGESQAEIAKRCKIDQGTVSREIGRAESFLLGRLYGSVVTTAELGRKGAA